MSVRSRELWLTVPSFLWLLVFFFVPLLIIVTYAFKSDDLYGVVVEGWTVQTMWELCNVELLLLLWRTFWLSALTTILSLLLALPVGYHIASLPRIKRNVMLMLLVIPFWSSFLIRIFAWKGVLHPEGAFHHLLVWLQLISPTTTLLYNSVAVLFVMVYNFLPFAILPIYAAAAKFNYSLIEAAIDLGASRRQAFWKVFVPGVQKGIVTAILMVFIPAMGTYVIPDLVGGINSEMVGNKIAQKTFVERSLSQASALSLILALAIFVPIALLQYCYSKRQRGDMMLRNRE
jgi:spermidine/putrescine transport system permease protein